MEYVRQRAKEGDRMCVYVDVRMSMHMIPNMCVCVCVRVSATVHYYTSHVCMHILIYHFQTEIHMRTKVRTV